MPYNEGSCGVKNPSKQRDFHREYGVRTDFMEYKLRLLWHMNPDFYAIYEPFLLGVEVVFNILRGATLSDGMAIVGDAPEQSKSRYV